MMLGFVLMTILANVFLFIAIGSMVEKEEK